MFGTGDPVIQISEALDALAGEDRAGWPGVALSQRLMEVSALQERLEAEWLRCAGQWDAQQAWAEDGAVSASSWLAAHTDTTRPNAVRKVRTARFAFAHEQTGDALADGTLSAAKAETLAWVVTQRAKTFAEHEAVILEQAPKLTPDSFVVLARTWREYASDLEARGEASQAFEERCFRLTDTLDGARIDGFVDTEAAGLIRAALDAIDRPDPVNGVVKARSLGQRYADALVDLAKESLARTERRGRFVPNIDAVYDVNRAVGRLPADGFGEGGVPGYGHTIGRRPISPATIERLLCDCNIGRVLMAGESEVLDIGRRSRTVTHAQWRALRRRDQHCRFPDCDRPPEWTDVHHTTRWIDGGETNLDDLVLLCRYHHVLCHEGGWTLTRHPDGTVTATRPATNPDPEPTPTPPPQRGPPGYTLAA